MYTKEKKINFSIVFILVTMYIGYFSLFYNQILLDDYKETGKFQYSAKKFISNDKDLEIEFSFFINKIDKEQKTIIYENLFQTADYNSGQRIEFSRFNNVESNWAFIYSDRNKTPQCVDLGLLPSKEQWHKINIKYLKDNDQIIIFLDGKVIKSLVNSNINFNFENIVLGYGFSKERLFNGNISNFSIKNIVDIKYSYFICVITLMLLIVLFRNKVIYFCKNVVNFFNKRILIQNLHKYLVFIFIIFLALLSVIKQSNEINFENYSNLDSPIQSNKSINIVDNVSIEFDFYINKTKDKIETVQYENLFQTADFNNGFRIEIAKRTESASIWGFVYTNNKGEIKGISLDNIPSEEKWHHIQINYLKDVDRLEIFLNGINIKYFNNANISIPNFSNVIVGKGFENRSFNGKIKNFNIKTTFISLFVYVLITIISLIIFLLLIIKGLKEHLIENNVFNKRVIFLKIFLFLFLLSIFSVFLFNAESYLIRGNDIIRVITILFTILSFITVIIFIHNLQSQLVKTFLLFFFYIGFYFYLLFYVTSVIYILGKVNPQDEIRRLYGLSVDEISAIYQTSISESIQFIITNLGYFYLVIIFLLPFILSLVLYSSVKFIHNVKNHKFTLSYLFIVITFFYILLPTVPTYFKLIYAGFTKYSQQIEEMKKMALLRKTIDFDITVSNNIPSTHILVIGESENKEHMGAYGYFRDTTPWLSKQNENENFISFQNSYAPYCHTIPSLLKVLTEANQYNQLKQTEAISIIDVVKKAGFNVYWLSEQAPTTIGDTPLSVIINESDTIKYVPEGGYIVNTVENTINNIDKSKNNLIIVHLMGSHADYKQRILTYNDGFSDVKKGEIGNYSQEKFKSFVDNILNPYDSSVKYTDQLLEKIYNLTANKYDFVDSFIYLSDHGEDVFGEKFHNSADFSYSMVHTPLIMYFSDRYKEKFQKDFLLLNSRKDDIFTNDLLYNTMLDIYKIESSKFENGYSLLDTNYIINESNALTMQKSPDEDESYYSMTNKRYIKDDLVYISKKNIKYLNKNYPEKVLSVNNDLIAKAYHSHAYGFIGSEFNVALESLKIGHYPDYIFETTLDEYLSLLPIKNGKKLWFDIKSPRDKDIGYSVEKFEELDRKYNLKKRVLIESWEDGIDKFSNNGWNTIYYIQGEKNSGSEKHTLYNMETKKRNNEYALEIANKIIKNDIKGISFFFKDYEFVKSVLEPLLPNIVTYNIFGLPYEYQIVNKDMINYVENSDVFNNKRVETILLDSPNMFKYSEE